MRLRYQSPLALPRTGADLLERVAEASVFLEPPGLPRHLTRYPPEFVDDPAQTGVFAGLGAQIYTSPPAFVTVVPRGTLFGYREIAWDGWFCADEAGTDAAEVRRFLADLRLADPFPNEDTGLVAAPDGDGFELDQAGPERRRFDGAAVVLCSHEPSNFGSFLFRVLPKLHAVRAYGLGHLPVVVWAQSPAFLELLRLAGVPGSQIIQHETGLLTAFDRVIAPSLRNPHGFLDAESFALVQEMSRENAVPSRGKRLYISRMGQARRGASTRRMVNEAEVAAAVEQLGFEVLEPERLTPAEQIAAFASADIVVGPSGSAMFNVVFCRPGTKVIDIESEPHWIYAHTGLFASCQSRYGIFAGAVDDTDPNPVHRRFSVDVRALVARISRFLSC